MNKKTLRTIDDLLERQLVSTNDKAQLEQVAQQFNVAITNTVANLLVTNEIAKQFVPSTAELSVEERELDDPTGDNRYEKTRGLIHRYPDRCLLKLVNVCPVYCRFCFRKEMLAQGNTGMSQEDLAQAYQYLGNHPEIWEVILTGGDPFILRPNQLKKILQALERIAHIDVVRIHTRIPIVDPGKITDALVKILKIRPAVYIVIHANHAEEFSQEAVLACNRLVEAGIPLLSQSVLLKGVNDNPEALTQLMRTLVKNRIKPYYLHHLDLAKGTQHFRVSIEEGQALMRGLQGKLSGLCQPNYVLDIPGGAGKVPIDPCYWQKTTDGFWLEDYEGCRHHYED